MKLEQLALGFNTMTATAIAEQNKYGMERPVAHVLNGIFFTLCCLMTAFSVGAFFKYRAFDNVSTMTLIGL